MTSAASPCAPPGRAVRILLAGVPARVRSRLESRLENTEVELARTGTETLSMLAQGEFALLVLGDDLRAPAALDTLSRARGFYRGGVIFCSSRAPLTAAFLSRLVHELKVLRVLCHPLDPEELTRQVATLLHLPVPSLALLPADQPAKDPLLAGIWKRFEGTNRERVSGIRRAIARMLAGGLEVEPRRQAGREAHQLGGSLGTFGLAEGCSIAREIEGLLQSRRLLSEDQLMHLSELALRLESTVSSQSEGSLVPQSTVGQDRVVILVTDDAVLSTDMVSLGGRPMVLLATGGDDARQHMLQSPVEALVVDLSAEAGSRLDRLGLITELSLRSPALPLIVLVPQDGLAQRLEVAGRGGRLVLAKPIGARQLMDVVEGRLAETPGMTRILAVDADPLVLASLEALLSSPEFQLVSLENPLQFWERLEDTVPDLLLLNIDLPHVSGIELCRAVRTDPRWADLPVMLFGSEEESSAVNQVFAAGADDFVARPLAGRELVGRIRNRLVRARVYQSLSETDPLTGALTRRKGTESIRHYLNLTRRRDGVLSLGVVDLDHFKRINDTYGHATGDEVLKVVARLLLEKVRSEDVVVRWGGEEFVVVLYTMAEEGARARLDAIRRALAEQVFTGPHGEPFQVAFSCGLAEFPHDGQDLSGLFAAADAALYEAKRSGRNRIMLASEVSHLSSVGSVDLIVVEKDPVLAEWIAEEAENRGYRVRCFGSAEETFHILGGPRPSLRARAMVLDHDLPGETGLELLRRLAQAGLVPRLKVWMLSRAGAEADILEAYDLGAADHLPKPFSLPILMRKLDRVLGPKRAPRATSSSLGPGAG